MKLWKYTFQPFDSVDLTMPKDAQILSIQIQKEQFVLWALVDPKRKSEYRFFRVFNTGDDVDEKELQWLEYITTIQTGNGNNVFHIFELKV